MNAMNILSKASMNHLYCEEKPLSGGSNDTSPVQCESLPDPSVDPAFFRAAMGRFATGVTVVSFRVDSVAAGMTANAFMSVSMAPPLVLVSVRREARLAASVRIGDRYGINVLAESQRELSAHFGGKPSDAITNPFDEALAAPRLHGCLAYALARVVDIHGAGDHLLYIGEVEQLHCEADHAPLIFYRGTYGRLGATA